MDWHDPFDDDAFAGCIVTIWRRCAVAAAAALVLGGCGNAADLVADDPRDRPATDASPSPSPTESSPTESSPTPKPTRSTAPKPKVGECRRIDAVMAMLGADNGERRTVPCGQTHNAQTYYVGRMSESMLKALHATNPDRLLRATTPLCWRKLPGWLGGSREDVAVSAFEPVVGAPTPTEVEAGARWFTCDVYAVRVRNDSKLAALPPNTRGILKSKRAEDWSLCNRGNFKGGTTNLVICTRPHTYRAVAGIRLGGPNAKYPGARRMDRSLERACTNPVRAYLGVPGGFHYAWTFPGRADWNYGDHWGLCYIQSKS